MKKFLAIVLVLIEGISLYLPAFALSPNFSQDAFTITVNNGPAISGDTQASPGDTLGILVSGTNNGSDLTNLKSAFTFSQATGFTYANPGQTNSYKWWTLDKANISPTLFNPPTLNTAPVSDTSANGDVHDLYYVNLQIQSSFSAPSLTIGNQFIADSYAGSNTISRTVFVNTRPHIVDYYFEKSDGSTTTSQIQWANSETINLVVKVKDYNGCTNIDGGAVTADLSPIGLGTVPLTFVWGSCAADGKTVTFKKTGITTITALGTYTFNASGFSAIDRDGNSSLLNDSSTTFSGEDKKSSVSLTVVAPAAPNVSLISVSNAVVGGPLKLISDVSFSGSQNGEVKVVLGGDGNCSTGTILRDWTGSGSYTSNTATGITVNASSLATGANTLYFCVRNTGGNIGSVSTVISKDIIAPALSGFSYGPANVISQNVTVNYTCNENGTYQVELWGSGALGAGTFVASGSSTASTQNSIILNNTVFNLGSNLFYAYCVDAASNYNTRSGSVIKTPPTPSMASQTISFADADIDQDGLDGRDLSFSWNTANGVGYGTYFESYRLYLLPSSVNFNSSTHTAVAIVANSASGSFTGTSTITKDSTNTTLVSGGSYKICIAIMGTNGVLGTEGCSSAAILTADTVSHPSVLSAEFASDTTLVLTTDATLDTNLSAYSGSLVSFTYKGNTVTASSVNSVNAKKLILNIPALSDISAVGTNLSVHTGAIHAAGGGYNNSISGVNIADGQAPTVTSFSTGTTSIYGGFYSGSLAFNYTLGESMLGSANTKIVLSRNGGNPDAASPHVYNITDPTKLSSGTKNITIDLVALGLVSGSSYSVQIVGKDLAGNSVTSSAISPVKFDNIGPATPNMTLLTLISTLNPTFNWLAALDDNGHGSGIKNYLVSVYNGLSCSSLITPALTPVNTLNLTLATALPTNNADYSWKIVATDNMGNQGTLSSCDDFHVDTSVPTITNQTIRDVTLASTTAMKSGDTINVTANVANSDTAHIWADLSAITGNAAQNNVNCAAPGGSITCSYIGGLVTYSFVAGFAGTVSDGARQIQIHTQNTSSGNDQTALASITSDSTAPVVGSVITAPTTGTVWGGNTQNITWSSAGVTDNLGVAYVKLEYSNDGGGAYTLIGTGSNGGLRAWDITALSSGANYKIRLTAYDSVGNSASTVSNTFTLDKTSPTITPGTITAPVGTSNISGNHSYSILWNTSGITDNTTLPGTPVALSYSLDGGGAWFSIASSLANNGSYSWSVPAGTNTEQAKIRLSVTDAAGNISLLDSSVFVIDSTNPSLTVVYAGQLNGNTPPNGKFINNSGIDITANAADTHMNTVEYTFKNLGNNQYWNGTVWAGGQTWNTLCSTNGVSCTVNQTVTPTIANGTNYELILKSTDKAGNTVTANPIDYVGDTTNPNVSVTTASGSYLSGSITVSGTASDLGSWLSSVKIVIQKGTNYWNGTDWSSSTPIQLATSTNNGYTSWNYVFTPPLADTDGQAYQVVVYAYDQAYKTNNVTSSTITVTKDAVWPTVAPSVWTNPITSAIVRWGGSIPLSWNPGDITDPLSWVATNGVEIDMFRASTSLWATIASGIPNNGSYNYATPTIDDDVTFRIRAVDNVGNLGSGIPSATITVDSLPPQIQSVSTMDMAAAGKVDAFFVTMSEPINCSTVQASDFQASLGATVSGISNCTGNSTTFTLTFAAGVGDSSSKPTLSYTKWALTDRAGNFLATVSGIASTDNIVPRVLSADILDANGNGKVDQIKVYVSENIWVTSDTSVWTITSPLPGVSATPTGVSVSGNTATLSISEPTNPNTSTGGMGLAFASNANYHDTASNLLASSASITLVDKAAPIVLSATTVDNSGTYHVRVVLSESVTDTNYTGMSLSGTATFAGVATPVNATTFDLVTTDPTATDTAKVYALQYVGTLSDAFGNALLPIVSRAVTDGVSPKVLTRKTLDINHNGRIDGIEFTFSEPVNMSFAGFSPNVGGYSISSSTASGSSVVTHIDEWVIPDTGATPAVQITNTSLADSVWNLLVSEASSVAAVDAVGPVILSAEYNGSSNILVTLSENFSGTLSSSDFTLSGSAVSITGVSGTPGTPDVDISVSGTVTYGVTELSVSANAIADSLGNKQSGTSFVKLSAPVIINEVMWSGTGASESQYIELRNFGASSIDLSGWKIDNASANGTATFTIPSGTIAAGGYFLITATAPSAGGNLIADSIVPNLVSSSLSLAPAQTNTLVLRNASNAIYDRALAPWPAGDGTALISMERLANPGNGLSAGSWYAAVSGQSNFEIPSARGTPGQTNVFDGVAPTITLASPTSGKIVPIGSNTVISYTYSDNLPLPNTPVRTFLLEKDNGAGVYNNVTASFVASSTGTAVNSAYTLSGTTAWAYRATFTLDDAAWNSAQDTMYFFVDNPTATVNTSAISLGTLTVGALTSATGTLTVTVNTLGAPFTLSLGGSGTLDSGFDQIPFWSGSSWFAFTCSPSGSATAASCSITPASPNNAVIETVATPAPDVHGNPKSYIYTITYAAKVTATQTAGNYTANVPVRIWLTY